MQAGRDPVSTDRPASSGRSSSRGHPMPNVRIRLRRLGPMALVALAVMIAGCTPQAVTAQGSQIQSLYDITFAVGAIIFFFVEGLIVFAVLRYRRKPGQTELPVQTHGNNLLEIVWTVLPLIIVT